MEKYKFISHMSKCGWVKENKYLDIKSHSRYKVCIALILSHDYKVSVEIGFMIVTIKLLIGSVLKKVLCSRST